MTRVGGLASLWSKKVTDAERGSRQTGFSTLLRDSLLMESGGGEKEAEGKQWLQGSVVRVHHCREGIVHHLA